MKLRGPVAVFFFALGAVATIVGDHIHVATGTTEYLSDALFGVALWLPALNFAFGVVVALLAEIGLGRNT